MRKIDLRQSWAWVFMSMILVIGLITLILAFADFMTSAKTQHRFATDSENLSFPGFHLAELQNHHFQQYVEALVAKKLRLRNFFIKTNNQLYYSLFKKSFVEDSSIIVGKNKQLFQLSYIKAYCHQAPLSHAQLVDWANKLKILSKLFAAKNITFIYLITPSKAEDMPRAIPERFHCQDLGLKPQLVELENLLRERAVPYINGPALMKTAGKKYALPMFPEGGTHWNWLGASLGTNALIATINHQRATNLPRLQFAYTLGRIDHQDMDADLIDLIKLMKPDLSYTVPKLHFNPSLKIQPQLKLSIIGGSFNENMIHLLTKNKIFADIQFLYYFNIKRSFIEGKKDPLDQKLDSPELTVRQTALSSDVVVLEENSSIIRSDHGKKFYEAITNKV